MSKSRYEHVYSFVPALLVLVFFYLHHFQEYYPFLSLSDPLWIMLLYLLLCWGIYRLFKLFFNQAPKAGIATVLVMIILLFFEPIKLGIIQLSLATLAKIKFLVPLLACMVALTIYLLYRSAKSFQNNIRYLTIALVAIILYECVLLFIKITDPYAGTVKLKNSDEIAWKSCDTCSRPDIYVLVADELASSHSFKEQYGEQYTYLDSSLATLGFQVINHSRSNYNISHFSIASAFNLGYLQIPNNKQVTYQDYIAVRNIVKNNILMNLMEKEGYSVQAYSCFHIGEKEPSPYFRIVADEKAAMFSMTMLPIIWNAFSWTFFPAKEDTLETSNYINNTLRYNDLAFTTALEAAQRTADRPKFVYSHLLMPHYPFLTDSAGNRRLASDIAKDANDTAILPAYLGYYKYCSRKIAELAQDLVNATKGEAIIYLIGDHGFRSSLAKDPEIAAFQNYNAVYFPKNEKVYPDTVSLVNEFRILLSKQFKQSLPLLEDSVYFLEEKPDPFLLP